MCRQICTWAYLESVSHISVFIELTRFGTTPLMLAVLIGAAQNILSKAAKYSLFDPCKESAFIPLDAESRTKGKAAVEVIGAPLGKSGGSFLQQVSVMPAPFDCDFVSSVAVSNRSVWVVERLYTVLGCGTGRDNHRLDSGGGPPQHAAHFTQSSAEK
jgi:ATP/ADP translocase